MQNILPEPKTYHTKNFVESKKEDIQWIPKKKNEPQPFFIDFFIIRHGGKTKKS